MTEARRAEQALRALLDTAHIWRHGTHPAPFKHRVLASGYAPLDAALRGGWQTHAITEILHDGHGLGELRLLLPALAQISQAGGRVLLVSPPCIPYAPAWAAAGVALSRLLIAHAGGERLWAAEQALRSGHCAAVLLWPGNSDLRPLRRLQLAAEAGASWGVVFRPLAAASQPSPATTRLRVSGDQLHVLKVRGARPGARLPMPPCSGSRSGFPNSH